MFLGHFSKQILLFMKFKISTSEEFNILKSADEKEEFE